MDKQKVVTIAAVGAGAYLVYWYITKHGPNGALVFAADGVTVVSGGPSYWDHWFNGVPAMVAMAPAVVNSNGVPVTSTLPVGATTVPGTTPATTTTVINNPASIAANNIKSKILTAAATNSYYVNGNGLMNADQWHWFYMQQAPAITADQFQSAFLSNGEDRNNMPLMSIDQFLAALETVGALTVNINGLGEIGDMGQIVSAPTVQSIPLPQSSSFGRSPSPNGMGSIVRKGLVH